MQIISGRNQDDLEISLLFQSRTSKTYSIVIAVVWVGPQNQCFEIEFHVNAFWRSQQPGTILEMQIGSLPDIALILEL